MKTNLWIWILTILLILTFLALCAGISLAEDDDIVFTATLIAEETWIPPEGQVNFIVELKNTGEADIERFEIITPDSMLAGEYGELFAGQSASVDVPILFNKEGQYPVLLFVVGYAGDKSLTAHTNSLDITVSPDPKPSEDTVVEEQTDPPVEEATVQMDEAEQTIEVEQTLTPTEEPSPPVVDVDENIDEHEDEETTTLYIIIGALGVLLLIIVIIIFGILNKNRHAD